MEAPPQVKRAVTLLWISLAIGILDSALSVEPLEPEDAEWEAVIWLIMVGIFLIAAALIYFISRRHNWARITYLILTALTVASYIALPLDIDSESSWSLSITALTTAFDIVALYWLFSGGGARWYSSSQRRSGAF